MAHWDFFVKRAKNYSGRFPDLGSSRDCKLFTTYSNTDESCWSPQINISAMLRKDSTSSPRLLSDTVGFRSKTLYRYFKWSKDRRFLGRFQPPPNQLRLRNIFHTTGTPTRESSKTLTAMDYWLLGGKFRYNEHKLLHLCEPRKRNEKLHHQIALR